MSEATTNTATTNSLLPDRGRGRLVTHGVLVVAFLIADAVGAALWLRLVTKGVLMLVLATVLWPGTKGTWLAWSGAVGTVALVFSSLGDILLELPGDAMFAAGIGAFLVAQACYVAAFRKPPGRGLVGRRPVTLVAFVGFWLLMNLVLTEAGPLRVPVLVYSAVIVAMAASALDLVGRLDATAARTVAVGAFVFVASDAMIALGAFTTWGSFPGRGLAVMITYVVGQALITLGLVRAAHAEPPAPAGYPGGPNGG